MAKIIYGVAGEGKGHYTRSEAVIKKLKKHHKIKVIAGSSAYSNFSKHMKKDLTKINSLNIVYQNNEAKLIKTVFLNLIRTPLHIISLIKVICLFIKFKPDIVITDFEPVSSYVSLLFGTKVLSIDNVHISSKTKIKFPKRFSFSRLILKILTKISVPNVNRYLIATFFNPEIKKGKDNVLLIPPILRDDILKIKPTRKKHLLVYQTSKSDKNLILTLQKIKQKFIIYGLDINKQDKNLTFKKFNEKNFFKDLGNCKAIISNGGFSLMTEGIHLRKPILSVPVKKQFEQILNAHYLDKKGYGMFSEKISKGVVDKFLKNMGTYEKNLNKQKKDKGKVMGIIQKEVGKMVNQ